MLKEFWLGVETWVLHADNRANEQTGSLRKGRPNLSAVTVVSSSPKSRLPVNINSVRETRTTEREREREKEFVSDGIKNKFDV